MKREAGDDPAKLAAAEKYWDKVKGDAAIEAVVGGVAGAATGGMGGALIGGAKAARGASKLAKPGIIKRAKDAIGNLFNRPPKELRDLKRQVDDPDFQKSLADVQKKMANDPKGSTNPVLRADPADRISGSGAVSGAIGKGLSTAKGVVGGAVKGAVGSKGTRATAGAAAAPAVLGPSKDSEVRIHNQNPARTSSQDIENRLRKPTTPTPAPARIR